MDWNHNAMEWLSDHAPMGVFVVDTDLKIRFWNRWMERKTGKRENFVTGKSLFSVCPEIETRGKASYYREALSGKAAILAQLLHGYLIPMPSDCALELFECMQQTAQILPVREDNRVVSVVTVIQDVTERMERELNLISSERRYRTLVENARDAVMVIQEGKVLQPNPAARRLFGFSARAETAEADFHRFQRAVDPEFFPLLAQRFANRLNQQPIPHLFAFKVTDAHGETCWIESNSVAITWNEKPALLAMLRNITRRKVAEEQLEAERNRLAVTLRSIGDGVIATDTDGRVVLINRAAEKMTGWSFEEALGKPLPQVFRIINEKTRKPCENPVEKVLQTGLVVGLANHTALIGRDGTERIIADSGSPIRDREGNLYGVVLVFQDVTAQHRMEAELARTRNLESLGVLAGGIAHDFNNILAVILGNLNLIKLDLHPHSDVYECTTEAEQAAHQAKALARQLLTFAKGGAPVKKTAVLADAIRETCGFAVRGSNVRCEYRIDEGLWPVDADVEQMGQVLNNLFINAKQAMPGGGRIRVAAQNQNLNKDSGLPLEPGRFVSINISDEGTGIPEGLLNRIFDPYFTTKQTGSGLGLAIAHSIISNHDGHISVASETGKGTTFTLYLPASNRTPEIVEPAPEFPPVSGSGAILVMDDEPLIRKLASRQLEKLGYRVALAEDGKEALSMYAAAMAKGAPFAAVIMDLTIPGGMGGKAAVIELLKVDPKAVALVSSGYADDPVVAHCTQYGFKAAIPKPFTLPELASALETALKGRP